MSIVSWLCTAPFGSPVVPDVNISWAGSDGAGRRRSSSAAGCLSSQGVAQK